MGGPRLWMGFLEGGAVSEGESDGLLEEGKGKGAISGGGFSFPPGAGEQPVEALGDTGCVALTGEERMRTSVLRADVGDELRNTKDAEGECSPLRLGDLPDDVLVHILGKVHSARELLRLRTVSKRLKYFIDGTPFVWQRMRFEGISFRPKVNYSSPNQLVLSKPGGLTDLEKASQLGNAYAKLIKQVVFDEEPLYALTVPQPLATVLVRNCRKVILFSHGLELPINGSGMWIGIHSARCGTPGAEVVMASSSTMEYLGGECTCLPLGCMVGLIHVKEVLDSDEKDGYVWVVNHSLELGRPIRCAGFNGLWKMSDYLSELVFRGAQTSS